MLVQRDYSFVSISIQSEQGKLYYGKQPTLIYRGSEYIPNNRDLYNLPSVCLLTGWSLVADEIHFTYNNTTTVFRKLSTVYSESLAEISRLQDKMKELQYGLATNTTDTFDACDNRTHADYTGTAGSRNGNVWALREVIHLLDGHERGLTCVQLSAIHKRSQQSIIIRLKQHGCCTYT